MAPELLLLAFGFVLWMTAMLAATPERDETPAINAERA